MALSIEDARQRILHSTVTLDKTEAEYVPIHLALNRVLAEDILATKNVPPHNNSAMDGYALNAKDLPSDNNSRILHIIGSSLAGHPFKGGCSSGECIQITTGAVIPDGLDTSFHLSRLSRLMPRQFVSTRRTEKVITYALQAKIFVMARSLFDTVLALKQLI